MKAYLTHLRENLEALTSFENDDNDDNEEIEYGDHGLNEDEETFPMDLSQVDKQLSRRHIKANPTSKDLDNGKNFISILRF